MVGRDDALRTIAADLIAERFVSIIGPGGMGKTTVAVAVAHAMLEEFADAVCFVDIGMVTDPKLRAGDHRIDARPHDPDRRRSWRR